MVLSINHAKGKVITLFYNICFKSNRKTGLCQRNESWKEWWREENKFEAKIKCENPLTIRFQWFQFIAIVYVIYATLAFFCLIIFRRKRTTFVIMRTHILHTLTAVLKWMKYYTLTIRIDILIFFNEWKRRNIKNSKILTKLQMLLIWVPFFFRRWFGNEEINLIVIRSQRKIVFWSIYNTHTTNKPYTFF